MKDINDLVDEAPMGDAISKTMLDVLEILLEKNIKYGNSALNPIHVFSKAGPREQLLVRIDDKLNRLMQGHVEDDEDVVIDLIGYLVLLLTYDDVVVDINSNDMVE